MNWPTSYVSVDTETTGLYPKYGDRIIQLSAVKYMNDKQVDTFDTLIDPDGTHNYASEKNNISDDELKGQPSFAEAAIKLVSFVGNLPWVGHNLSFDFRFMQNEGFDVSGYREHALDTLAMARRIFGRAHNKLWQLEKRFDVPNNHQHNSLSDALATAKIYQQLRELAPEKSQHKKRQRIYHKHIIELPEDNQLAGAKIVFTGHFKIATRDELRHLVERHGGKSPNSVSKATDYLVTGIQTPKTKSSNGSTKELRAMRYDVPTLTIDEFLDLLGDV